MNKILLSALTNPLVISSALISSSIIGYGFINRYEISATSTNDYSRAYRIDKMTGDVWACFASECRLTPSQ